MAKRITGSSVTKGDLVVAKQLQLRFESSYPWMPGKYQRLDGYGRSLRAKDKGGVGVVIKALPKYDRSITENDCSVFWIRTQTVTQESSQCLKVLSPVDRSNS